MAGRLAIAGRLTILCGLIVCTQANAQVTTGSISGVVKDVSGAVIPEVAVVIKNLDTGLTRTVTSDASGRYQAPSLTLGNYEIQAQVSGFRTEVRSGIQLTVGREAVVDFTLAVGDVTQSVQVTGEAPMIDTTSASITGLVDESTIRDMPLNGRSFDQLVLLQAGSIGARRSTSPGGSVLSGGARVSIAGARPLQNTFLLDGTDVNDYRGAMPGSAAGVFLGVDTVREFRVLTSSYNAEYGRSAGGTITAVTKSGTNDFHGSAFEFLRNSALDARNFFDPASIRPFKRNQFGLTAGGPVRKNKSFFFGGYESLRERLGVSQILTVPSQAARAGVIPGRPTVQVPAAVVPLLALYPIPNGRDFGNGMGEYIFPTSQSTDEDFFSLRGDHTLSAKHSMFGRYTFDNAKKGIPGGIPIERYDTESRNQYVTIALDSIFSPTVLNSFRSGFNRSHAGERFYYPGGTPAALSYVPGVPFEQGGLIQVAGLPNIGNQRDPQGFFYNLFEWSDDVTMMKGRHSLKTGLIIKRIRSNRSTVSAQGGLYNFTGGVSSLIQGAPGQFQAQVPGTDLNRGWRTSLFGFYFQDDLKLTPRLTLNLGIREEFMTSPNEVNGKAANWPDVMLQDSIVGNPFFETHKFNLAPRFGFAWDRGGNAKLVVRGGFGFFYDQPFPTYWEAAGGLVPPYNKTILLSPAPPYPNAFQTVTPSNLSIGDMRGFNYRGTGYSMQYNFTIQSQITPTTALKIGFLGSQGRKMMRTGQMNTKIPVILPDGRQFFPANAPLRNSKYGQIRIEQSDANSSYNGFVLNIEKQWSRRMRVQGSYTFSKVMSVAETVHGADFVSGEHQVMDPYNLGTDRSPASFDIKHNLVFNYSYTLPFERPGTMGKALNGWELSGITTITTGVPFPVMSLCCSGMGSTGSAINERPDLRPGSSNNPVLGGPDMYFDRTAFSLPQQGFYGTLGRNTVVGPGLFNFDFSLIKNTPITEKTNLQFRAEFFNLFNRANFGTPANQIFDARGTVIGNVGRITTTATTSRQIQFALKIVF